MSHELTVYLSDLPLSRLNEIVIFSEACKPENLEFHNSLKLGFTSISGFCSTLFGYNSFLEANFPDILALSDTNLDDSIDSCNFSMREYFLLIQKDSVTHMYGLAVYMKERFPFPLDLSLENSQDFYFWLYFIQCLTSFSLFSSLCTVFDVVSSNINEVLSINSCANAFVFGDFNARGKSWLIYSGGTDRGDKLC